MYLQYTFSANNILLQSLCRGFSVLLDADLQYSHVSLNHSFSLWDTELVSAPRSHCGSRPGLRCAVMIWF